MDLAKVLSLTDPEGEHKPLLEAVCKKLEDGGYADDNWDESNLVQSALKEAGMRRYRIDVELVGKVMHKSKDHESILCLYVCVSLVCFAYKLHFCFVGDSVNNLSFFHSLIYM